MPIYSYKCKSCDHQFEAVNSMNERNSQECRECGSECDKLISNPRYRGNATFEEGWFEHIDENPIYVNDRNHLKKLCRDRGSRAVALE